MDQHVESTALLHGRPPSYRDPQPPRAHETKEGTKKRLGISSRWLNLAKSKAARYKKVDVVILPSSSRETSIESDNQQRQDPATPIHRDRLFGKFIFPDTNFS